MVKGAEIQLLNGIPACIRPTCDNLHLLIADKVLRREQLTREPRPLPRMVLNPEVKSIDDYKYEDFTLEGYDPWPAIKGVVSV